MGRKIKGRCEERALEKGKEEREENNEVWGSRKLEKEHREDNE